MSSSSAAFSLERLYPPPSEQLCYVHCNFCDTVLAVHYHVHMHMLMHTSRTFNFSKRALHQFLQDGNGEEELQCQPPNLLPDPSSLCNANNSNSCNNGSSSSVINSNAAVSNSCDGNTMGPAANGMEDDQLPRTSMVNRQAYCIVTLELVFWSVVYQRKAICRNNCTAAYRAFKLFPVAIVDEIQRIKAGNPDITHREAFSAAAKNWAHFPHIHFGLMPDQGLKKASLRQLPYRIKGREGSSAG
ncbi:hypothetical protein ZIOFF_024612 [Zingiber officinale]|uniref:C2H2-type domain-containing protein n=1 Tax=Zingiber officinale TaxID=94328 RepID=A0A8J5HCS5_ZINOF|nr:hypothetical protein ZIOFF_024612 [Zingiber officinale]